jgi:hypothetical protein
VILFKWAAKSGDYLGDFVFAAFFTFLRLKSWACGGWRAAGRRLGVDLWGIGHSFGGSDF